MPFPRLFRIDTPTYHYKLDRHNGRAIRYGTSLESSKDPRYSPVGPELIDIEVSTPCSGPEGKGRCIHCYKAGKKLPHGYMMAEIYRKILQAIPSASQVALGIGDYHANPELETIVKLSRDELGVIPNITISGQDTTTKDLKFLSNHCGSVGVSIYECVRERNLEIVSDLLELGPAQVNLHLLLAKETIDYLVKDVLPSLSTFVNDQRVAILFLLLKPTGNEMSLPSWGQFTKVVEAAEKVGLPFGFDSCIAVSYITYLANSCPEELKKRRKYIDSCEACCFSAYINVRGNVFPCSFCEESGIWKGINVHRLPMPFFQGPEDFIESIWFSEQFKSFRKLLRLGDRACPVFDLTVG